MQTYNRAEATRFVFNSLLADNMLRIFAGELPATLDNLLFFVNKKDTKTVYSLAYGIKMAAEQVHAERIADAAEKLMIGMDKSKNKEDKLDEAFMRFALLKSELDLLKIEIEQL